MASEDSPSQPLETASNLYGPVRSKPSPSRSPSITSLIWSMSGTSQNSMVQSCRLWISSAEAVRAKIYQWLEREPD